MVYWVPHGVECRRGRQTTRWEDELVDFFKTGGPQWDKCAEDRDAWGSIEESFVQAVGMVSYVS